MFDSTPGNLAASARIGTGRRAGSPKRDVCCRATPYRCPATGTPTEPWTGRVLRHVGRHPLEQARDRQRLGLRRPVGRSLSWGGLRLLPDELDLVSVVVLQ